MRIAHFMCLILLCACSAAMTLGDGSLDPSLYMDAYLHPNRAGYDVMAEALRIRLAQL